MTLNAAPLALADKIIIGASGGDQGVRNWLVALDAKTGNILWQYRTAAAFDVSLCCGNVNRGVAIAEGKVFVTTLAAHVIALDAATGRLTETRSGWLTRLAKMTRRG